MASKYGTAFLLLYAITNEKTDKLTQIDWMLAASKTYLAETRSNNSGVGIIPYLVLYTLSRPTCSIYEHVMRY